VVTPGNPAPVGQDVLDRFGAACEAAGLSPASELNQLCSTHGVTDWTRLMESQFDTRAAEMAALSAPAETPREGHPPELLAAFKQVCEDEALSPKVVADQLMQDCGVADFAELTVEQIETRIAAIVEGGVPF
jgi:hypothetical protein